MGVYNLRNMSRFSDFDDFLKRQKRASDESINKLQQSRDDHDLLIRELFRVFQEYFDTVIKPRKDYFVIAKKKELLPSSHEKRSSSAPYYLYRINLVPKDTLPLSVTPYAASGDYLKPGEILGGDWHPYVAIQFDVSLHDVVSEEKLSPKVTLRFWGNFEGKQDTPIEHPINVSLVKTALTESTVITIPHEFENPDALVDRTSRVLMMITPSVLASRQ